MESASDALTDRPKNARGKFDGVKAIQKRISSDMEDSGKLEAER